MKKRLDYLDKAKGLLIILMVYGHVVNHGYIRDVLYCFHMPAFFVISGILLHYTNGYQRKPWDVLVSRLYAFGIPFLFYEATGPITDIILNGALLNIKGYIYNTITLSLNNKTMWFLIALFLIEVSFVILLRFLPNARIIISISVLLHLLSFIIPSSNGFISQIKGGMRYYVYFVLVFYFGSFFSETRKPLGELSAIILLIAPFIKTKLEIYDWITRVFSAFIALSGTYSAIQFSKVHLGNCIDRVLAWIGKNSLVIYGTHHIYYICIGAIMGIKDYTSTPIWKGLIIILGVAILEIPTVFLINRYLPFLAGKHFWRKEAKV